MRAHTRVVFATSCRPWGAAGWLHVWRPPFRCFLSNVCFLPFFRPGVGGGGQMALVGFGETSDVLRSTFFGAITVKFLFYFRGGGRPKGLCVQTAFVGFGVTLKVLTSMFIPHDSGGEFSSPSCSICERHQPYRSMHPYPHLLGIQEMADTPVV